MYVHGNKITLSIFFIIFKCHVGIDIFAYTCHYIFKFNVLHSITHVMMLPYHLICYVVETLKVTHINTW